eukprot:gene2402-2866_t
MKIDNEIYQLTKEIQERLNVLYLKHKCEPELTIALSSGDVYKYEKPATIKLDPQTTTKNPTQLKQHTPQIVDSPVDLSSATAPTFNSPFLTVQELKKDLEFNYIKVIQAKDDFLHVELFDDPSAYVFSEIFKQPNLCQKLKISGNNESIKYVGAIGWSYLATCLNDLDVIHLTRHKIGIEEAKILMVGISMNRNLQKLDLWENSISSETAIYITLTCLERNPNLKNLNLD